jgi:hypothetical protein
MPLRPAPASSTFAFKVRHSDAFWFRGVIPDAEATLRATDLRLAADGSLEVEGELAIKGMEVDLLLLREA